MSFFHRSRTAKAAANSPGLWWEIHSAAQVFGLNAGYTRADVELAFRRLARKMHPDMGGSQAEFQVLVAQRDLLLSQAGIGFETGLGPGYPGR